MFKISNKITMKELLDLKFEYGWFQKVHKYSGNFYRDGVIKTVIGYSFCVFDKDENRENDLIYIDRNTRILKIYYDVINEDEFVKQAFERLIYDLIKADIIEVVEE